MIVRQWRGRAEKGKADQYPAHFAERVVPLLTGIPGFKGADLLERELSDCIEFTVVTRWDSFDAIHAFVGDPVSAAEMDPGLDQALYDYDVEVTHFKLRVSLMPG